MTEEQCSVAFKQELSGYSNKLLDKLYMQWDSVSFCDMFIVTQNKHLPVHACVLSAFSSRVSAHISKSSSTFVGRKLSPPYIMKVEFSYEVIDTIVRALYTGVFCPPTRVLAEVYAAVEWLDIFELSELLKKYFERSPQGQASEDENMNCAVNTDSNTQAGKLSDSVDDFGRSDTNSPELCITWDTSIKEKSTVSNDHLVEYKNHSVELARRTARKRKSLPHRYNQEQFVLDQHKKVWPPGKSCSDASLSTSPAAEPGKESHPSNEANLHTGQKDLLHPGAPFKDKLSVVPVDHVGKTLASDNSEAEKADSEKSTAKATDASKTPWGAKDLHPVLSSKPKKKKPDAPQGKEVATTVTVAEVSEIDPIKSEIDLFVADIEIKKCEKCFMKFSNLDMYIAHISDHPVFTCHDCGEVFFRKFNYTKHQRDRHLGRPYLKCSLCGHQAINEAGCRSHSDEVHGERKPFVCPEEGCGFRARRFVCVTLHMKIHNEVKEYCCEKCGQRFNQERGLLSHHNACYQLGSFLCDLCGQSFNHQQSMKIHRSTMHMQEKPYICKVCSKQFTHHSNLKRHMRIHNNVFPYSCPICKQPFRHSNTLKGHMSARHKGAGRFLNVLSSDPSNRLGGFSYKRKMKSRSAGKVVGAKTGGGGKRRKRDWKGSKSSASAPHMFQSCSLSEEDALPSPEEGQFIIDGIDLDEEGMSNSNPLDSLDVKQLDLSGDNVTVDMDNDHFNNLLC